MRIHLQLDFLYLMTRTLEGADADKDMQETFQRYDGDNDGFISVAELRDAISSVGGEQLADEHIDVMIREADAVGDGRIDCMCSAGHPKKAGLID